MINKSEQEIMSTWKGDVDSPLVSVRCTTYNHIDSLGEALDSFLEQVTDFPFEVVVHDDASTDGTTDLLLSYKEKYPHIIKTIIQKENQYSKHNKAISQALYSHMHGKYIAVCEGDDLWTDSHKLQLQHDYMEEHPECSLCVHNTTKHNLLTKKDTYFSDWKEDVHIMKPEEVFFGWYVHTSSSFYKKELLDYREQFPAVWCGDYAYLICAYALGTVAWINRVMSQYNYNNQAGVTWHNKQLRKKETDREEKRAEFLKEYNRITDYRFNEIVTQRINRIKAVVILSNRLEINSCKDFKKFKEEISNTEWYGQYLSQMSFQKRAEEKLIMSSYFSLRAYSFYHNVVNNGWKNAVKELRS